MVQIQNIAIVAAIGAATYATASPVEQLEALEARTWNTNCCKLQLNSLPSFNKKTSAWAPVAPWNKASLPSSSYGCGAPGIPKWNGGDKANNYQTVADSGVYQGQTVGAATIDNANYMTYLLVDSVDKCLAACDATDGCFFVNLYQDNASSPSDVSELPASAQSKYTPGNLTCALYKACSGTEKATNYGGQQDPTFITQSSGYCKNGKC
uniref:Uncharacterized protein n=1 Tax=Kalmanozyma brasiliensis (strain GHG001) TaxID=1365824 RepID=V5EX19_KALBG